MYRRALLTSVPIATSVSLAGCTDTVLSAVGTEDEDGDVDVGDSDHRLGEAPGFELDTAPEDHELVGEDVDNYEYVEEDDEFELQGDGRTTRTPFDHWGSTVARKAGSYEVQLMIDDEWPEKNVGSTGFGQIDLDDIDDADPAQFDLESEGVRVTYAYTHDADGNPLNEPDIPYDDLVDIVPAYGDVTIRFDAKPFSAVFPVVCRKTVSQRLG